MKVYVRVLTALLMSLKKIFEKIRCKHEHTIVIRKKDKIYVQCWNCGWESRGIKL